MDIINTVKQTKAMWHEQNSSIFKRTANTFEPVSFESISGTAISYDVEHNGSGGDLWTFDHENPGSNPVLHC